MNLPKYFTRHRSKISNNKIFLALTAFYTIVLFIIGVIACFFAYNQEKGEIFNQLDLTFLKLEEEYNNIIDNFWQLYMPIFEGDSETHTVIYSYFSSNSHNELSPLERHDLSRVMQKMLMRDNRVQWIAFFCDNRSTNYILFNSSTNLQIVPEDFAYLDDLLKKKNQMEVYGMKSIHTPASNVKTFAICGSTPAYMGKGKILAGYDISSFEQICQSVNSGIPSLSYMLTNNTQVLFSSIGQYEEVTRLLPHKNFRGIRGRTFKDKLFVNSKICANKDSLLSYQISWWKIFVASLQDSISILIIVLAFALISFVIYAIMLHYISREVRTIQHGLEYISTNHLDYRITTDFKQSGLPEIAQSINNMTQHLQENINRAYHYELKQKEAELAELQAKFNPHFLYNSLEMIRSRCYQNQDIQTAELITQLSAIFRGFIGSKTFIPLQEELAFSKRYLALFGARYGDMVQVRYDFDTDILSYGIIRNVFQPLIENYFVHGFDYASGENNYICFRGKSLDEETMILTVEDNGCGMSDEELKNLNSKLHMPIELNTESYGLKNLHQRLQLFYGRDCGIRIYRNGEKGIRIDMKVLKLKCDEIKENV